jgi:hypothetical protein
MPIHQRDEMGIVDSPCVQAMQKSPQVCPKCNGSMEQGFIVDMSHAVRVVSSWARGAPLKSWIFETVVPADKLPIGAFRCSSCGYLESYAREEFARKHQKIQFSLRNLLILVTIIAVMLGIVAWWIQF